MIEHLKDRLNRTLKERGKKPAPFAAEIGLKSDVIRDIFRKDAMPSAERLALIADGLDVSIDYLLGRTEVERAGDERRSPEDVLRSAMLSFGVDKEDLGRAVSAVKIFLDDDADEQSEQGHSEDQFAPSNRRHEPTP